jgi:hypothetical protein
VHRHLAVARGSFRQIADQTLGGERGFDHVGPQTTAAIARRQEPSIFIVGIAGTVRRRSRAPAGSAGS